MPISEEDLCAIGINSVIRNKLAGYTFENNFTYQDVYGLVRILSGEPYSLYLKGGLVLQIVLDDIISRSPKARECTAHIDTFATLGDIDMGILDLYDANELHNVLNSYRPFLSVELEKIPWDSGMDIAVEDAKFYIAMYHLYSRCQRNDPVALGIFRDLGWRMFGPDEIDQKCNDMEGKSAVNITKIEWVMADDVLSRPKYFFTDRSKAHVIREGGTHRYAISSVEDIEAPRGNFHLARLGPTIKIRFRLTLGRRFYDLEYKTMVPFVDLSCNTESGEHVTRTVHNKKIRYQELDDYLTYDLSAMLYEVCEYPWILTKYEKRTIRYITYFIIYPLIGKNWRGSNQRVEDSLERLRVTEDFLRCIKNLIVDSRGNLDVGKVHGAKMPTCGIRGWTHINEIYNIWYKLHNDTPDLSRSQKFVDFLTVVQEGCDGARDILEKCFNVRRSYR